MEQVAAAAVLFVGTHFLLSHPLRAPLVRAMGGAAQGSGGPQDRRKGGGGERGFLLLYSLVAAVTLGWLVFAYRAAPMEPLLWPVGDGLWAVATIVMLMASVLLVGSLIGNPALPTGGAPGQPPSEARGVYAVTRHPMMWAFALWAAAHAAVYPTRANFVLVAAIAVLALVGAAMQDRKKEALQPGMWPAWERKTSYLPFAAIAAGRAKFGSFRPHDWAGGTILWLAATWAHIPLGGAIPAGVFRWIGG